MTKRSNRLLQVTMGVVLLGLGGHGINDFFLEKSVAPPPVRLADSVLAFQYARSALRQFILEDGSIRVNDVETGGIQEDVRGARGVSLGLLYPTSSTVVLFDTNRVAGNVNKLPASPGAICQMIAPDAENPDMQLREVINYRLDEVCIGRFSLPVHQP